MARADLHTHSTHSDGTLAPRDLVRRAAVRGVEILALTDHDTTAGILEARAEADTLGLRLIAGIELSTDLPAGGDAHLLAYFQSVNQPALQDQLARYRDGRSRRGLAILARLDDLGLPLDWERVQAIAGEAAVGRPHFARAMVERGYVASVREAFERYLYTNGPADAAREKLPPPETIRLLREAGGVVALAHPALLPEPEEVIAELSAQGLQGLEVHYKNHDEEQVTQFAELARRHSLIATGGSDFHGLHEDEREPGQIDFPNEAVSAFVDFAEDVWAKAAQPTGSEQ